MAVPALVMMVMMLQLGLVAVRSEMGVRMS